MKLTSKLLSFLNRVFDKRAHEFLALRLRYDGAMQWSVSDGVLTTTVAGGSGSPLSIDLSGYTITDLAVHLQAQRGYSIAYVDRSDSAALSALALLDANNDQGASNGDHLYAYTSLLYVYLEAVATELQRAGRQVVNALTQMEIQNSEGSWVDYWGSYFGIPRTPGEVDETYAQRIIVTVLRPRGNNVAMAAAISASIGGQPVTVEDVTIWGASLLLFNSATVFDGSHDYNNGTTPVYGLFDVTYGYDLLSSLDPTEAAAHIRSIVEELRDAGTQMRSLLLQASTLTDSVPLPTDGGSIQALALQQALVDTVDPASELFSLIAVRLGGFLDTVTPASDALPLKITYATTFDGSRTFDGAIPYQGGSVVSESL